MSSGSPTNLPKVDYGNFTLFKFYVTNDVKPVISSEDKVVSPPVDYEYEEDKYPKFCQKLRIVLLVIELSSAALAEAVIKPALKKYAAEALEEFGRLNRYLQETEEMARAKQQLEAIVTPERYPAGVPEEIGDNLYVLRRNGDEIFRGTKQEVDEFVERLKKMSDKDAKKLIDELESLKTIDEAIKELNITIIVPKNTLTASQSLSKIESIIKALKNKVPPKVFNPHKEALKKLGISLPKSKNGLSVDFANTPYLYPVKGNEKNIVKIKLTGTRKTDDKLAYELANIKKNKDYTWHHLDDYNPIDGTCTMQLVEKEIHRATVPHYGSVELIKKFFNLEKY